jgi:predicted MPP superfamily phosphohydrolase
VSLALLSDLHNADPEAVLSSLRSHRPDLICITGDVLYGGRPEDDTSPVASQANVLPFLRSCASIAPTFLSLGNHEWMVDAEDLRLLSSTGVTVLDNEWKSITVGNEKVVIGGLTSGYVTDYRAFRSESGSTARYPRQESISGIGGAVTASHHKPETDWLSDFAAQPGCKVLLSHHPEYFPLIPDSVDLILSGHAHGGQIRMYNPLKREWIGTWSPGQGWWPRYTKGVYDGRLVVSAGLSNTTWIPRLCNPTEVVYIEGS